MYDAESLLLAVLVRRSHKRLGNLARLLSLAAPIDRDATGIFLHGGHHSFRFHLGVGDSTPITSDAGSKCDSQFCSVVSSTIRL